MNLVTKYLTDTITYWSKSGVDIEGNPTWSAATSIPGRWIEQDDLFVDSSGRERRSTTQIYSEVKLPIGTRVYLGTSVSAAPEDDSYEIKMTMMKKAIDGVEIYYKAML